VRSIVGASPKRRFGRVDFLEYENIEAGEILPY
jgi:hypothetical protein